MGVEERCAGHGTDGRRSDEIRPGESWTYALTQANPDDAANVLTVQRFELSIAGKKGK